MLCYNKIKDRIDAQITRKGNFSKEGKIPSERKLAELFGVGKSTINKAISMLVTENKVIRKYGVGTFVNKSYLSNKKHSKKIKIRLWASDLYIPHFKNLLPLFKKHNPQIDIDITVPDPLYFSDNYLITQPAEKLPHMLLIGLLADLSAANSFLALDELWDYEKVASSILPELLYATEDAYGEQHVHGMPFLFGTRMMVLNKDLVSRANLDPNSPPRTWMEFLEWLEILSKNETKRYYGLGISSKENLFVSYSPFYWMVTNGKALIDLEKNIAVFNNEEGMQWLNSFRHIYQKGYVYKGNDKTNALFLKGNIAIALSASSPFLVKECKESKFSFSACKFPVWEKESRPYTTITSRKIAICKKTISSQEEKDACWEWIKFLIGQEAQTYLYESIGYLPVRIETGAELHKNAELEKFYDYRKFGIRRYDFRNVFEIFNVIETEFDDCMRGVKTAKEALNLAEYKVNTYLKIKKESLSRKDALGV